MILDALNEFHNFLTKTESRVDTSYLKKSAKVSPNAYLKFQFLKEDRNNIFSRYFTGVFGLENYSEKNSYDV